MNDLFETPELIPANVLEVIARYEYALENGDAYIACRDMLAELEQIGFTFEYGLDGIPFDLMQLEVDNAEA